MTAKQLREFILWLRKERIAYTTLSAGGVTLDGVVDLKMVSTEKPAPAQPRETMFEKYGAELMKAPAGKPSDAVPDEALVE
jgi:hypothetical protein